MRTLQLRSATPSEEAQFNPLIEADIDEVYKGFGMKLGTLGPEDAPVGAAKKWLKERRTQIHKVLCVEGDYCEFAKSHKNARTIDIVVCVADTLATAFGALPVYNLSVLLVRRGLDEFCDCK